MSNQQRQSTEGRKIYIYINISVLCIRNTSDDSITGRLNSDELTSRALHAQTLTIGCEEVCSWFNPTTDSKSAVIIMPNRWQSGGEHRRNVDSKFHNPLTSTSWTVKMVQRDEVSRDVAAQPHRRGPIRLRTQLHS